MLTLETLTGDDLRGPLNAKSLRRAHPYVRRVQNPVRAGQTLTAQVRGGRLYHVEVEVGPGGIQAHCTCSYDWGGYCKHVGAVLLKWIRDPGSFAAGEPAPTSGEYPIEVIPVEPPPTRRPRQLPVWVTTSLEDRQGQDRQDLEKWLTGVRLQDLRGMAKARGWRARGTRKSEVVRQIAEQITNPDDIRRAILNLDREHHQVLRALVLLGSEERIAPEDVKRVAGAWGPLQSYKQVTTYTRHLWEMGLALPSEVRGGYPSRSDFVPPAIGRHFLPVLEGVVPASMDLQTGSDATGTAAAPGRGLRLADPYALVRTANQVTLLLERSPIPLRPPMPRPRLETFYRGLKRWEYDPHELRQVEARGLLQSNSNLALTVPPPGRSLPDDAIEQMAPLTGGEAQLEFLFSLLVAAGVFQPGSPTTVWPEVKVEFLRRSELIQRAILARTYFQMQNWSELWEVLRAAKGLQLKRAWRYSHYKPESLSDDLRRFRQLVLRTLASLPDGRWVALEDLFRLMRTVWPRFDQQPWASSGAWFLARDGQALRPGDVDDWELAQGSFIREIIGGPLHWLGFADLQLDGEKLAAFRLHGLADLYWDRVEVPSLPRHATDQAPGPPPAEAVTTEDFDISVNPSAVSVQAHNLLDKIARLDVVEARRFVYRLDAQAAYESFESGVVLPEILDDWERLLPLPMPERIRARLAAWWETYGRVRIYQNLTVVEFGDEYALAEMKAVTSLEQYLIAEISPRLVIVRQEAMEPLTAELERAGYTPKQTDQV